MGERVADDLRLLVDLLGHEVTVIALFGEQASGRAALDAPRDRLAGGVAKLGARPGRDHPVALLEIGHAVGEGGERQRVRAEIGLAVAVADRKRRAEPRADQEIVLPLEQINEREGAAHALERRLDCLRRRFAARQLVLDHEGGDLGIRFGFELVALCREFLAQRLEILDDAVVDDRQPARGVRVGVGFGRLAVGRPAGVADADRAHQRRGGELRLEVLELALGAPPHEFSVLERRNACRVIASIFKALERVDDSARDGAFPKNSDDSAHKPLPWLNGSPAKPRSKTHVATNHFEIMNVKSARRGSRNCALSPIRLPLSAYFKSLSSFLRRREAASKDVPVALFGACWSILLVSSGQASRPFAYRKR